MIKIFLLKLQKKEFAKNVLTLMAGTLGAQLLPLLLSPILTRLYSPENFGIFSLFSAVCFSIATLSTLRYELAILLPKSNKHAKFILYVCSIIICITSFAIAVLCYLYATELSELLKAPTLAPTLKYVAIGVFLIGFIQALSYWHLRQKHFTLLARNKFQQSLCSTILQILAGFLTTTSNVFGLILGFLISQLYAVIFLFSKTNFLNQGSFPNKLQSHILLKKYSNLPIMNGTNAVVDTLRVNGINILIAMLFNNSLLGQFALAWRILQAPISLINGALSQVSFQTVSQLEGTQIFSFAVKSIKLSFFAGIIPFTLIYLLSPTLFPIIFGPNWTIAGDIAQSLCPWLFLNLITSPLSTIFIVIKKQLHALIFSIIYAICPLWIIYTSQQDIVNTVKFASYSMSVLLVIYIIVVLLLTHNHKNKCAI